MDRDKLIEKVAEALGLEFYGTTRANTSEFRWGICLGMARAALAAIAEAGLVVVEPVGIMLARYALPTFNDHDAQMRADGWNACREEMLRLTR